MSGTDSDAETCSLEDGKGVTSNPKEVRLNRTILLKGISSVNCDKREPVEVDKQFPRVTHLHLQSKGIDVLGSLHHFRSLTVLYLYNNRIREIVGLENARNLEALYLQRNRIGKISGLLGCRKLRKIYLGQNEILVVEGLHQLPRLEELHVEHQCLQPGEQLIFDPTTLDALSKSLQVLNISRNGITSIEDLAGMEELHTLYAEDNALIDLDKTSLVLTTLKKLKVIDLRRNPMAKSPKYQEKMIGHCQTVELLDGKTYSATSRQFITKFCEMKANHLRRSLAAIDISPTRETSGFSIERTDECKAPSIHYLNPSKGTSEVSLEQIFPIPRPSFSEKVSMETDIDLRMTQMNLNNSQHKRESHQPLGMNRRNANSRLLKPQEISLPDLRFVPKFYNSSSTLMDPDLEVNSISNHDDLQDTKYPKGKVFKGLASRGFSAVTNISTPPRTSMGRSTAVSRHSTSSVDGMMPTSRSFNPAQPNCNETGSLSHGDAKTYRNPRDLKKPEPKVFKFPPWPHILRNLSSTEKVAFI